MKTRVITGAVLVLALLLMVLIPYKWIAAVVFGLLMAIGSYELLYGTGMVRHPRLVIYAAAMAFLVTMWSFFGAVQAYMLLLVMVFFITLFGEMMHDHVKVRFDMIAMTFVAGFVVPLLLGGVIRILSMKVGRYFVIIPFIVAYMNDAGAYLVGIKYGKHKLSPVVSPNKTYEGMLGGLAGAVLGMILYSLVLQFAFKFRVNYLLAVLYGILGSSVGVFGDLCFSVVKRQTGIKDYGNLFPGHGGVLDRFDSMVMVAPLIEVLLTLLPWAV